MNDNLPGTIILLEEGCFEIKTQAIVKLQVNLFIFISTLSACDLMNSIIIMLLMPLVIFSLI